MLNRILTYWVTLALFLSAPSAKAMTCLTALVHPAPSEGPYELIRDEEYPAFDPRLRDGSFLLRVVRTRTYFVRDKPVVLEVANVETRPEVRSSPTLLKNAARLGEQGKNRFLTDISAWVKFAFEQFER